MNPDANETVGGSAPDGQNVMYHDDGGAEWIGQILTDTLREGKYALTAAIGLQLGEPRPRWGIELLAGGTEETLDFYARLFDMPFGVHYRYVSDEYRRSSPPQRSWR